MDILGVEAEYVLVINYGEGELCVRPHRCYTEAYSEMQERVNRCKDSKVKAMIIRKLFDTDGCDEPD